MKVTKGQFNCGALVEPNLINTDLLDACRLTIQWLNDPEMYPGEIEPIIRQAIEKAELYEGEVKGL